MPRPGRELEAARRSHERVGNSIEDSATPAGFESVRDLTRPHVECRNSSEAAEFDEATSSHTGPICNDCNEVVPRLARVAKNALLNGDFPRVISILDQLSTSQPDRQG